jgi:5-methylcytosine-specific restriction endonuclease McrA
MEMVTRDICGSEGGYRKHRRMKEEKCQPCKDAHNVHRRATYNPDKNREHQKAYKSKPEKQELLRQLQKKYQLSPEEKAKRALERKAIAEKKKQLRKAEKRAKYEAYLAEIAERKAARIAREEAEREERTKAKEERRAQERLGAEIFCIIEKELKQKAKEQRRQERLAVVEAAKAEKARLKQIERDKLNNQHGTSVGDYDRCRKNNPTACGLCLAVAAKYRREQIAKDPQKFNKQKRESNKRLGKVTSRDRAKKNGGKYEYYTRQQILDRDGSDCYLCQEPVDFNAPHTRGEPGWETYPHVEHVIPLAKGGDDTLSNVKIAHAKCNIDKGVRLLP